MAPEGLSDFATQNHHPLEIFDFSRQRLKTLPRFRAALPLTGSSPSGP
ncbi:hypothetical protein HMPREF0388_1419 [Mobiluncus curtisii ATCC 51333]|uniref:Uncharacterized protein n=1 Tax=Mobiluncus curtisii ATCC 51333 TaxID=887326 RepID=E6M036_9ACTO|nr:hypothetical protein HMPREF0388_1419 [Mobiluncus curtisii ATCC 51333]